VRIAVGKGNAMIDWRHVGELLDHAFALDLDALQLYAAIFAQLGAALRRPLATKAPWLCALAAGAAVEAGRVVALHGEIAPAKILLHIGAALVIPTLLLILARYFPRFVAGR
jgi:hypothetical protein